ASPLPWATQVPPEARITESSAVTTPLAGALQTIRPPPWLCWYGSRLETTTILRRVRRSTISSRSPDGPRDMPSPCRFRAAESPPVRVRWRVPENDPSAPGGWAGPGRAPRGEGPPPRGAGPAAAPAHAPSRAHAAAAGARSGEGGFTGCGPLRNRHGGSVTAT